MYYEGNSELYHHGIKGMKWGVRRYQNFDGSYTQAGVKRYQKSMDDYDRKEETYKMAKASGDKVKTTNARIEMNNAKRQVKKDYNHLKEDKRADKGKELYSKGYRISGNAQVRNILLTAGSMAISAAIYNEQNGNQYGGRNADKLNKAAYAVGGAAIAAGVINQCSTWILDNQLRSYYSHSSKY